MSFDNFQERDLDEIISYGQTFWRSFAQTRASGRVTPKVDTQSIPDVSAEPLPMVNQPLSDICRSIDNLVVPNIVKNSHPLFLGYVTPPSLDIGAFGDAITAILNQNVAFASLSPIGTAIENKVIEWLAQMMGYTGGAGGVMVSGGSEANLYGLAAARQAALNDSFVEVGNYVDRRRLRVYCSVHTHHSIDKAQILLGIGKENLIHIPADGDHRIMLDQLDSAIRRDLDSQEYLPIAIVGNAGTRQCCAFDDLEGLRNIASKYKVWLHVDAAYGGFLRLAKHPPRELQHLHVA